tara:strand:- start:344 stop:685 length:342 start_codon:yes stop_codon:yes gene_type:complete
MKPTIKNINKYLQAKVPQLQFVKGRGYFYFSHADDVPEDESYIMPDSIYTYALHQLDWERWTWEIDRAVAQFEIDNENTDPIVKALKQKCRTQYAGLLESGKVEIIGITEDEK